MLLLAAPVALTQLAQILLGFTDTVMAGRLGPDAVASIALGNATFFVFVIFGIGAMNGVGPMVSQAFGAGDTIGVGRSVRQGFWLGLFISIPIVLFLQYGAGPFLYWIGQDPDLVVLSERYLYAVSWGVPPFLWYIAERSFAEGVSQPLPALIIAIAGIGVNIIANTALMFGRFGFPEMGVVGTGWASAVVYWVMFVSLGVYIHFSRRTREYDPFKHVRKPDLLYLKELTRIGWPIGVSFFLEASLFMATAMMMGLVSKNALAAHQVAIQCAAATFMIPLGIGLATAVRVGQATGRKDPAGAARAGYTGMALALCFMFVTAIMFWTMPRPIVTLFFDPSIDENVPVIEMAITMLGIAAVFQLFDGLQVSAGGALRGLKDTRVPMVIGLLSYWGCGMTTGIILAFVLDLGAVGLWWGLVIGLLVASITLTLRFYRLSERAGRHRSAEMA
ncbi:MAG: MATE family efflux transporter [Rhodothermales bacterium]|nr:MATE family efflux transporter [Rhodothermales bacterium]